MGIEFKDPGDDGYYPGGKGGQQIHLSGWGCIVYPLVLGIVVFFFSQFEKESINDIFYFFIKTVGIVFGIIIIFYIIALITGKLN